MTTDSIRKSARQLMQEYRAGRSIEGDDVANVAHDLEDAAAEIARLTAELDVAWEVLTIANTTAANLHNVIRRKDRELEAARTAFAAAMEYVHESHHAEIVATLEAKGIDLDALASTPPDTEGGA